VTGSVAQAIAYADAQLGKPYLWGGESETNGFDCSGLVQSAYGVAGVGLPRTAAAQYAATSGQQVPDGAPLQVGDLVFFGTSTKIHHVGIYVGNGLLLNAPHTGAKVRIDKLSGFPDTYAATRPLTDGGTVSPAQATKGGFKLPGSGVVSAVGGALNDFGNLNIAVGQGIWGFIKDPVGSTKSGVKSVASSATSAVASAALSGVQRYVVEGVLLAGGVGLVGLGIYRGVKQ
jgi:uncharacterized protein YycO